VWAGACYCFSSERVGLGKAFLVVIVAATLVAMQHEKGTNAVRITSLRLTSTDSTYEVRLTADRTIVHWQKPEVSGSVLTIRLPEAVHAATIADTVDGVRHSHEVIRNILVERWAFPVAPQEVEARRDGPRDLVITLRKPQAMRQGRATAATSTSHTEWALDVIVLDPGHGGIDVGAEGVNGVYEKNVTLSIAQRLRTLLRAAMPNTKVVMTRDDDTFIELYRRGQIANEAGGKLFISIHCNSMPTKPHPARGCETYILRPGRNQDAARVAARENASIRFEKSQERYKGMTEDQLIVATMAQASFVRLSELLARHVQHEVSTATKLKNRGVNQAGFYVLVGSSMPNILFETAFLSNPDDAAYVCSSDGQANIAASMLKAIQAYERSYANLLNR